MWLCQLINSGEYGGTNSLFVKCIDMVLFSHSPINNNCVAMRYGPAEELFPYKILNFKQLP